MGYISIQYVPSIMLIIQRLCFVAFYCGWLEVIFTLIWQVIFTFPDVYPFFHDDLSCHVINDTNTKHGPYNELWKGKTEMIDICMNLSWKFITYMQFIIHQYLDTAKGKSVNQ